MYYDCLIIDVFNYYYSVDIHRDGFLFGFEMFVLSSDDQMSLGFFLFLLLRVKKELNDQIDCSTG